MEMKMKAPVPKCISMFFLVTLAVTCAVMLTTVVVFDQIKPHWPVWLLLMILVVAWVVRSKHLMRIRRVFASYYAHPGGFPNVAKAKVHAALSSIAFWSIPELLIYAVMIFSIPNIASRLAMVFISGILGFGFAILVMGTYMLFSNRIEDLMRD